MSEEEVGKMQTPAVLRKDLRWEYQTVRDERLYAVGWFADFRGRWRADLERERLVFRARMEAL